MVFRFLGAVDYLIQCGSMSLNSLASFVLVNNWKCRAIDIVMLDFFYYILIDLIPYYIYFYVQLLTFILLIKVIIF